MAESSGSKLVDSYLARARRALSDGEFDFAIEYADLILSTDPENEKARQIIDAAKKTKAKSRGFLRKKIGQFGATAQRAVGRHGKALEELEMLHRADPSNAKHAIDFALACVHAFRLEDGSAAIQRALPTNWDNGRFLKQAARFLTEIDQPAQAVPVWKRLTELHPKDPEIDREYRNAEAAHYHEREAAIDPTENRAEIERHQLEEQRLDTLDGRIEQYILRCKENPDDHKGRVILANYLVQRGTDEDLGYATEILDAVVDAQPGYMDAVRALADVHRKQGILEKALEVYDRIASDFSEDLRFREEHQALKEEYYSLVLKKDPENQEARRKLEGLRSERFDREVEELEQKVKVNPSNPDLAIELGDLLCKRGKLGDAIRQYQTARRFPQRAFRASKKLGELHLERDMPDLAIREFEKALELAPVSRHGMSQQKKSILYALGCLYQDELDNAERAFQYLSDLYAEDIGFEDVEERFNRVYALRQKEDT